MLVISEEDRIDHRHHHHVRLLKVVKRNVTREKEKKGGSGRTISRNGQASHGHRCCASLMTEVLWVTIAVAASVGVLPMTLGP